ncbi:hypothetical protein VTN96DRAFT_1075 [Rasamsonia emersonii]|uniref:Uncharacterized protein n=1 Tax=Rasamsonia emersonii (strain ATCC 16479 / CBS 393.64 / IMI 116815) TaxID=1408163 RepID=A0A0F4YIZ3_RASE3|nr:hypothetical protein T310_7808 [Rasamsonia emersonii CBS 393.64]KKA18247.1 hypothetical protein T310_7808 [Rasamsonia emersonii CBS 393.64]
MASLSRAFTLRNKRPEISGPMPYREGQVKFSSGTIRRGKISGPVELLSSTNMLVYTAPDVGSVSSSSSTSSFRSGDETSTTSPMTSPHASSTEVSPIGPEPNHVSTAGLPKRSATITTTPRSSTSSSSGGEAPPSVPKRALSHTKKSHQELARQRSVSRMTPPPSSLSNPTATIRRSQDFFQPQPEQSTHPFSRELDKVNEVAEDFGASRVLEEEEQILLRKGLKKFSVEEYLSEIEDLYGGVFDDQLGPPGGGSWL